MNARRDRDAARARVQDLEFEVAEVKTERDQVSTALGTKCADLVKLQGQYDDALEFIRILEGEKAAWKSELDRVCQQIRTSIALVQVLCGAAEAEQAAVPADGQGNCPLVPFGGAS